ncbi:MAG: diguanylate cyclase [candidate division KSB1 bacterium]|nr:diguanylate cyclase [candidate division KSB1 bacterium]MDZ7346798.1 diguanylate cyclase [candidate division KSB1 bacterium]
MSAERQAKILIVDDVPPNLELLRSFLDSENYRIFSARNCEEALKVVDENEPDLIILDVTMSNAGSVETCRQIKAVDRAKYTPIIMVTGTNESESKILGLEAGADDFVGKPFNKIELLTRVRSLLRVKMLHDQLQEKIVQLERAKERLKELAVTDGLTSLYNYRFFREALTMEIRRSERHKTPLSLIMFDIDDFKLYNDRHGHLAGDKVLQQLASLVMKNIRRIDVAVRYGGEEFAVILPGTTAENACFVAEKLRGLVENHPFPHRETQPNGRITISVGVASYSPALNTFEALVDCADKRLYMAKARGKNIVVFEGGC